MDLVFLSHDESATERFGEALARVLPPGSVVALVGTLGAGKTRLVQAVAKAIDVDPAEVVSPTFVLVHEYRSEQGSGFRVQGSGAGVQGSGFEVQGPAEDISLIYHVDAYRIRDEDEFYNLGPEEFFESGGWTFVEWADRVAGCLPEEHVDITIEVMGPLARRFTVTARGQKLATVISRLAEFLEPA
jgi:tRNA threonylcarbamoyladenosine biosynthesis protein TsaE